VKDKCKHIRKQTKRCVYKLRGRELAALSICIYLSPGRERERENAPVKLYIFISSLSLRKALDLPIYLPYWPNYFIFIKKCATRLWNATASGPQNLFEYRVLLAILTKNKVAKHDMSNLPAGNVCFHWESALASRWIAFAFAFAIPVATATDK